MERLQIKDLTTASTWDEILNSNANWGSLEQANRIHSVAMAKLAKTIERADKAAAEFNRRAFWLAVSMLILAAIQCMPILIRICQAIGRLTKT